MRFGFVLKWLLISGVALSVLGGCSVGPKIIGGNVYQYNMAVSHSQHEALLLNLVRTRYNEPVFFLQTSAIASSFSVTGNLGATFDVPNVSSLPSASHYKIGGTYGENPTISYTPLGGQEYISRLLQAIDQKHFLLLFRSGVRADSLINALVERFGKHFNAPGRAIGDQKTGASYLNFIELSRFLTKLQQRGDLEMIEVAPEKAEKVGLKNNLFAVQCRFWKPEEADKLDRLLGTKTRRKSQDNNSVIVATFAVTYTHDLSGNLKIPGFPVVSISLRSFVEILYHLARGVDVPESDLHGGLARPLNASAKDAIKSMLNIKVNTTRPEQAFVSIPYRNRYYYIDDRDLDSKEVFVLLSSVFELQSGDVKSNQPVLTLPVGGF